MIDYVLLSEGILDRIHKFSLSEWTLESDHRDLYVLTLNVCIGLIVRRTLKIINNHT